MNKLNKRDGRRRVYFMIITVALILTATRLYNDNKGRKLEVNQTQTPVLASVDHALAQAEPEIVPEPTPEPIVQLEAPKEPETINQAQANVTHNPTGCDLYRPLVEQYAWDVNVAMAIMRAESGCNPNAENWHDNHGRCSGSFGLFQLACFWTENPKDPATNVAKAYDIYSKSGWRPWGAYTNGSYLRYL